MNRVTAKAIVDDIIYAFENRFDLDLDANLTDTDYRFRESLIEIVLKTANE